MKLGEKIKLLRKERGYTLDRVADITGLAKATLSRIENSITIGNLNSHLKICEALQVNIGELYKGMESIEEKISFFSGKKLEDTEVFNYGDNVSAILLAKQTGKKRMLPQLLIIEPQKGTAVEEAPPGTDKFLYLLEGTAELKITDKIYPLKKNSSIYFDASLPHSVKNAGTNTAKLIMVVSPVAL